MNCYGQWSSSIIVGCRKYNSICFYCGWNYLIYSDSEWKKERDIEKEIERVWEKERYR